MSNNSIIEHRANYYYVEAREEYIEICKACAYKKPMKNGAKSKASPYCKALILAILENWLNNKRGKGEDLVVYMSYPQWISAMYGMFGRNVIIDSIDELIGEGLISREPYKMFGRDSFQYRLNCQELNRRIRQLPERDPNEMYPNTSLKVNATSLKVNGSDLLVNATSLKVTDDPSKSKRNIESTKKQNIESKEGTGPQEIDSTQMGTPLSVPSSPSFNVRNTEPLPPSKGFSEEESRIDGYWQELGFLSKPTAKEHWLTLSGHIKSFERFKSLYDYTKVALKDKKDKRVYPGNLVDHLDGWKQAQTPVLEQPTKQKPKITKEYLASLPL